MLQNQTINKNDLPYLKLLAKEFPTQAETFTEIINLQAIMNLPKGTEHFMSLNSLARTIGPATSCGKKLT